jgi:hypothetical protein
MVSAGYVAGPMQQLYDGLKKLPTAVGSGMIAAKRGYHSSRAYNEAYYPGDYSTRYSIDQQGPSGAGAATDTNLSDANMVKYTKLLIAAMRAGDPRVKSLKEVIGTVDNRNVVRFTRTSRTATPEWASSDSSHLWHIHLSIFRADVDNWDNLKGILEVLTGGTISSSSKGGLFDMLGLKKGDKGPMVGLLQVMLTASGFPCGDMDEDYGSAVASAVLKMRKSVGSSATSGDTMTRDAVEQLLYVHAQHAADKLPRRFPKIGDVGPEVGYYQRLLNAKGAHALTVDNKYGPTMADSISGWFASVSGGGVFDGEEITSWIAAELQR